MLSTGPEDDSDRNIRKRAAEICQQSGSHFAFDIQHREMVEQGGAVGQQICNACDDMEADFLCVGTKMIAQGAENRENITPLGSVALYCSQHVKCHAMVFKP
eukprot:Tamp_19982.p1 GENE.Tamp_19982~~Tamp_19982.p1  ORF type:complete len:102 (-),score=15.42 Tamp_19982:68-373(-)